MCIQKAMQTPQNNQQVSLQVQRTPEYIFFEEYIKSILPNRAFSIEPYYGNDINFIPDYNSLYFTHLTLQDIECEVYLKYNYIEMQQIILPISSGQWFMYSTMVQPPPFIARGYVARFQIPLFNDGF